MTGRGALPRRRPDDTIPDTLVKEWRGGHACVRRIAVLTRTAKSKSAFLHNSDTED
jgi:hypothetical protein